MTTVTPNRTRCQAHSCHCSLPHFPLEHTGRRQTVKMIFHSPVQDLFILTLSILSIICQFGLSLADPLITVCDSSQYKRVVEDTCSSVYKRMKHPHHHFESMRHHDDFMEKHRHRHHFKHRHHAHSGDSTSTEATVQHTSPVHYDFRLRASWSRHRRLHRMQMRRLRPLRSPYSEDLKTRRESSLPSDIDEYHDPFAPFIPAGSSYSFHDLPSHCCEIGCPHSLFVAHCDL